MWQLSHQGWLLTNVEQCVHNDLVEQSDLYKERFPVWSIETRVSGGEVAIAVFFHKPVLCSEIRAMVSMSSPVMYTPILDYVMFRGMFDRMRAVKVTMMSSPYAADIIPHQPVCLQKFHDEFSMRYVSCRSSIRHWYDLGFVSFKLTGTTPESMDCRPHRTTFL